jgi:hypothetical protein
MGQDGDRTLVWDEDSDDAMEAFIADRMKDGCSFSSRESSRARSGDR